LQNKKLIAIVTLTIVGFVVFAFSLWRGWGVKSLTSHRTPPWKSPEFQVKWKLIEPLMDANRKEPFTPQELQIIYKLLKDELYLVRADALLAFSFTPDPKQQKEAIYLALKYLKDPHPHVRSMALIVLWRLNAKDCVEHILPLLQDPDESVRKDAIKVLRKWGYEVRISSQSSK